MSDYSRYIRVAQKLYTEPVMITPDAHGVISQTFEQHVAGEPSSFDLSDFEQEAPTLSVVDGVGIIEVSGPISRKISNLERGCGACGVEDISALVAEVLQRDDVVGFALRVDSPGGSGIGTPEVAAEIAAAAKVKPVIAYADGLMASAVYYLSAGCSAIYAAPSSLVGSIGTYIAILDQSRAAEMQGVKVELFKAGRLKAAGYPGTAMSEEQKTQMQGLVDGMNDSFRGFVQAGRGGVVDVESMQGQVFTAAEAMDRGLVDSLSSFDDAVRDVRALAGRR